MSSASFKSVIYKICLEIIYLIYMYKTDLVLNDLQWLMCHKTKPNLQVGLYTYCFSFADWLAECLHPCGPIASPHGWLLYFWFSLSSFEDRVQHKTWRKWMIPTHGPLKCLENLPFLSSLDILANNTNDLA